MRATGATGAAGADGKSSLIAVVDLAADGIAPCPYGGKLISAGVDDNGDGVLDAGEHRLTFSNAGHDNPFFLSDRSAPRRLTTGGIVLGAIEEYPFQEETIPLAALPDYGARILKGEVKGRVIVDVNG